MTELMTLEEVADYLRVTEKTVYRLLRRGKIPATKVGHQWRFHRASIDEWLNGNSVGVKANILVIDDEEIIQVLFKETLGELGHNVMMAGTGPQGLELVKQQDFDLVFLDLKMPGMDGAQVFRRIKTIKPNLLVTIITGYPESDMMTQAMAAGVFGVMRKPFSEEDIMAAVHNFVGISRRTR